MAGERTTKSSITSAHRPNFSASDTIKHTNGFPAKANRNERSAEREATGAAKAADCPAQVAAEPEDGLLIKENCY